MLSVIDAPARRRALVTLACAMVPLAVACGKKGPPLAPLARLPVPPAQVSVSRAGDVVSIRFVVPNANVSGLRPADIERVDVYAWTGPALVRDEVFKVAQVVASVPVRMPPPAPSDDADAPPPPPPVGPGVDQGALTALSETLDAEDFVPIELPASKKNRPPAPPSSGPDALPLPPPLVRQYVVVGVNRRGKRGTPAAVAAVPLWKPPPPPVSVTAKALEAGTEVSWVAPDGLRRPVQERAIEPPRGPRPTRSAPTGARPGPVSPPAAEPSESEPSASELRTLDPPATEGDTAGATVPTQGPPASAAESTGLVPSRPLVAGPAPAIGYHVYEVAHDGGAPAVPRAKPDAPPQQLPARLTTAPLKGTTYSDARVEFGVERCYVVRTVETIGKLGVESEASARACVDRADVFPPAAPRSVAAIATEGAISLIWDANTEPDLAGYVVLRAVAPGVPAERLMSQPIRETTFRDTTVRPGTRYVYAVIAVDTATPPNASAPSNLVEETAR